MSDIPNIYLDTSIIRDVQKRRNTNSTYWVKQIKEKNWEGFTSIFGFMELFDIEQEEVFVNTHLRRNEEFNEIYRKRFTRDLDKPDFKTVKKTIESLRMEYSYIQTVFLSEDGWKLALFIAKNSNIFSPDAIHLATAWENKCDLIITTDNPFIKEGTKLLKQEGIFSQLRICCPENVRANLKSLGFGGL